MAVAARVGARRGLRTGRSRFNPWLLAAIPVCLAVGVIAGVNPLYGIVAALGLMFAVVTFTDLAVGLVLFTVASFMDVLSSSGSFSGTKVIGLVVFVAWLARSATQEDSGVGRFVSENPWLTAFLVGFLVWSALSFTWAFNGGTAVSGAFRLALDVVLVPIAFSAIRRREHLLWVAGAFVVAALLSGVYGLLTSTASTGMDAGRLTGTLGESNAEGTVLAASIPLLIAMIGSFRDSARLKLAALVAVVLLFASLVDTLSREGLVSLAAAMVAAVIMGGRWRRQAAVLLVLGVIATIGYYGLLAPAPSTQRVTMSDTSGRSSLWTVALRVIAAHPALGVGNDNFIDVADRYINRPGAIQAAFEVTTPKMVHNTFLEAAADLGIPGLLMLLGVFGLLIGAALRAAHIFERLGDADMELLARGIIFAVVATLASDFFVSGNYAKYQWLVLALCPAVLGLARRQAARPAAR